MPKMADAGRQTDVGPAMIRNKHKIFGRITFVCWFGAAGTALALALSPRALAGGPIFSMRIRQIQTGVALLTKLKAATKGDNDKKVKST